MTSHIKSYLNSYTNAATLAFYRLVFGFMMLFGLVRFASYGWIDKFYIQPSFHFTYYGFSWVKPIGVYTYGIFILCALAAIGIAIGYRYRLSAIVFFISFTYIELMDKTTYLNHYYFISIVSFVMIFLPAASCFSVDVYKKPEHAFSQIPRWTIDILKLLLAIVYFYAGLAKLNSDWLLRAMPLKIWLSGHAELPLIGHLMLKNWIHYFFSWFGAIYDLGIVFLLINKRFRLIGFAFVVAFHLLTALLFPIGMFPYVMIVSTLIFFGSDFHKKCLEILSKALRLPSILIDSTKKYIPRFRPLYNFSIVFLSLFLLFQLAFPFRYLCYPGELFWTEEGFRFSWRVMLMEKAGYAQFIVTDSKTGKSIYVNNEDFLTRFQEKQMSFQPDFILEYAHYLHDHYEKEGMTNPEVRVNCHVALNGRLSRPYIDPKINLADKNESFKHKDWILPFEETIWGL
ncbi:deoxyribonuclease HsdR [Flavobacterium beibuense F44-8]|uniref:Deoxyribonuclease HsdR n=1 Tax=Flavobacterium beibuense F44-8 TaxID=1406840 RepID=A0A0A2LSN6_9FLAO|nr:HTTM domain-containing protein [Flavobacterium beibuense]KGO79155.1 deoxyribonuclease HsdR [Flavobacterium beibuense F44-8]